MEKIKYSPKSFSKVCGVIQLSCMLQMEKRFQIYREINLKSSSQRIKFTKSFKTCFYRGEGERRKKSPDSSYIELAQRKVTTTLMGSPQINKKMKNISHILSAAIFRISIDTYTITQSKHNDNSKRSPYLCSNKTNLPSQDWQNYCWEFIHSKTAWGTPRLLAASLQRCFRLLHSLPRFWKEKNTSRGLWKEFADLDV